MKTLKNLILAVLASGCLVSAQAATLSLTPSAQNVAVGGTFSVDLAFDAAGSTTGVGAYDLAIGYDASLLKFIGASFGSGLDVWGLGSWQTVTQSGSSLNLYELSFDSSADILANQPTSFRLATLTFASLATGAAALGLSVNALADANGSSLSALTNGATVNVSAVPEPESYAMLLAGLGLLGFAARRKVTAGTLS